MTCSVPQLAHTALMPVGAPQNPHGASSIFATGGSSIGALGGAGVGAGRGCGVLGTNVPSKSIGTGSNMVSAGSG